MFVDAVAGDPAIAPTEAFRVELAFKVPACKFGSVLTTSVTK